MPDRNARVWTGSAWELISAPVSTPNAIATYQATPPSSPTTGQIWIDSDDNVVYSWNGSSWISIQALPSQIGQSGKYLTTSGTVAAWSDPFLSPQLTGIPTAPTAVSGNNTTQIATTAFTTTAISNHNVGSSVHGISGSVVGTTDSQTLTNKLLSTAIVLSPEERCNIISAAATGTINIDVLTSSILFYTSNATANHTINIRGNSGTTLNSILSVGDSITVVWMNTNGTTPFFANVIQIDGSNITPRWQAGVAPTSGNPSSIDAYTFTIIKTASTPTYTVLGSQTRFA